MQIEMGGPLIDQPFRDGVRIILRNGRGRLQVLQPLVLAGAVKVAGEVDPADHQVHRHRPPPITESGRQLQPLARVPESGVGFEEVEIALHQPVQQTEPQLHVRVVHEGQRLLVASACFLAAECRRRAVAGPAQVLERFHAVIAVGEVMREHVDELGQAGCLQLLDGSAHCDVERAAPSDKKRRIRDVLDERVLERVLHVGEESRLVHELQTSQHVQMPI
jgi:hypothetical protein